MQRDRYEAAMKKKGKELPYKVNPDQERQSAENLQPAAAAQGKDPKKDPKKQKCNNFMNGGACKYGKDCWFRANTPGHP